MNERLNECVYKHMSLVEKRAKAKEEKKEKVDYLLTIIPTRLVADSRQQASAMGEC